MTYFSCTRGSAQKMFLARRKEQNANNKIVTAQLALNFTISLQLEKFASQCVFGP
jgi:hypothetical protein